MSTKTKRITITLPEELVHNVTYISTRMRISRSAFLAQMLEEPMTDLYNLIKSVPEDLSKDDEETIKRAKGDSKAIVEARLDQLQRAVNDLFSSTDS